MKDPRARPTLFVPLIGLPALFIFLGGGIALGVAHSHAASNIVPGIVPAQLLGDPNLVPNGAYVETEGEFYESAHYGVRAPGAPDVMISNAPFREGHHRTVGRVCDVARPPIGCNAPRDRPLEGERWFLVGETPEHSRMAMLRAFGVAAAAFVVYVAFVLHSRRRRKGPARVAEERTWTVPSSAEDVALALRTLTGVDRFTIVDEGPGRIVFIQGYSENAARGWGVRKAEFFPRRATITWRSSPREPTQVAARVEEDLLWWPPALTPTMQRLAQESIGATLGGIERVLDVR